MKYKLKNIEELEQYFINNAINVNNKKLQKLLYFAQSWFVTLNNDKKIGICNALFEENIEAWRHGPAVPSSYRRYKENGFSVIEKKQNYICKFDNDLKDFLDYLLKVYDKYNGDQLESITQQQGPWKKNFKPNERNNISLKDLYDYYINDTINMY